MNTSTNPRIAIHTAKSDLSSLVLSPITYKHIKNDTKLTNESTAIKSTIDTLEELVNKYKNKNKTLSTVTKDELLKKFIMIPKRNKSKTIKLAPKLHLNFKLFYTQSGLLIFAAKSEKQLNQVVIKVQENLFVEAKNIATKIENKTTLIKELLRSTINKIPSNINFWAVLEKGSKTNNSHIHLIVALDNKDKGILRNALSKFCDVKFKNNTTINGVNVPIDIGAAYYFAKSANDKYLGFKNFYVSPELNKLARTFEKNYSQFIKDNKLYLLKDGKKITKAIQKYEQKRIATAIKTYEEWEEKTINNPQEELDTGVYWEEIEGDTLSDLDALITSLG